MLFNATASHVSRISHSTPQLAHPNSLLGRCLAASSPAHTTSVVPATRSAGSTASPKPGRKPVPRKAQQQQAQAPAPAATAAATAGEDTKKLLLIDGHNMAFKAYWGLVNRSGTQLQTADGVPTTVAFGFLRSLIALLEQERPDALLVAFDAPVKSFRHEVLPSYKSHRAKAPPLFHPDLRNLQQLLRFLRVDTISAPGYEADDVIAGAAQQASQSGYSVRVYSTDQDLWQVVDDAGRVAVLLPVSNTKVAPRRSSKAKPPVATLLDEAAVRERLDGVSPTQIPDYKALVGDASDNVPGVPGIGPKTAAQLLTACGSLEGVFEQLASHKEGVVKKLQGRQEEAALFKDLTRVRPEAAPAIDFSASILRGFNAAEVEPLLRKLEMMSLVKNIDQLHQLLGGSAAASPDLAAALPAALEQLSQVPPQEDDTTPDMGLTTEEAQQESSNSGSSSSSSSSTGQVMPAAGSPVTAPGAAAGAPAPVPAPAPVIIPAGGRRVTGPVSALPESLAAVLPDVMMVASQEQLQQLLDKLQQHKGPVTWSWPQSDAYKPGTAPPLPSFICCTWEELCTAQSAAAPADAASSSSSSSSSSSAALPPAVPAPTPAPASTSSPDGNSLAVVLPRRRRSSLTASRTVSPTATTAAPATPPAAPAPSPPPQPQQQQQQQAPGQQSHSSQVTLMPRLAVIPLGAPGLPGPGVLPALAPLLEDASHPKVLFESKRCYTEMKHWGIQLAGVEFDVLVGGCLLDPERWTEGSSAKGRPKALDPQRQQHQALPVMVKDVLNTPSADLSDLAAALKASYDAALMQGEGGSSSGGTSSSGAGNVASVADAETQQSVSAAAWRAAAEVWAIHALQAAFMQQLQQPGNGQLLQLLQQVELPVQRVLSDMEVTGMGCNREALLQQKVQLQEEVALLEAKLLDIAGEHFNLKSRKELSRVMFDKLGIKPRDAGYKVPMTTSGYQVTSLDVMHRLESHPFVTTYLEWSGLSTLVDKYYNASYIDAVNPDTGRVHTTLMQVGGATGRINSSNPNLQNIPVHMHERGAQFRQGFNHPAPGYVVVSADYSQVELRVLAALSGEQALIDAFAAGRDVHEATARVLLERAPQDAITPEERQMGKRVNFSIVYGAGANSVATDAGVTTKEANTFLDRFYQAYPRVFDYLTNCQRSAVARGYTQSVLGRRRLFSFRSEKLRRLRGTQDLASLPDMQGLKRLANASREDPAVLRQAGNAPIQGTSADVLKVALVQLHRTLTVPPYNCRLLLTVHDEALLEVPNGQWPAAKEVITEIMEGVLPEFKLNLRVNVEEGF